MNSSFFINLNRCINLTYDDYNAKNFLAKNYYNETYIIDFSNIQSSIEKSINNLASKLPLKKVPGPIYILMSRKLEYDGYKYGTCLDQIYANNARSDCFFYNSFKTISAHATLEDIKKSNVSNYSFKNNYEIFILYPNITNDLKYFINYSSFLMSNQHVFNLIADPYLYQVLNSENKINYYSSINFFLNMNSAINPNSIAAINNYVRNVKKNGKYSDYEKMNDTLCGLGGCASEYREPLNKIFTPEDTPRNNYVPNKCLLQLNKNIYYNNFSLYGINITTSNLLNVNEIGNIYNNDDKDKYNKTKEYEDLNKRYVKYPGIQEIVFSAFQINTDYNNNVLNMPWGNNVLLSNNYVISDLFPLLHGNYLYSTNNNYRLLLNPIGQLFIYKKNFISWELFKSLNDRMVMGLINLSLENNTLIIKSKIDNISILTGPSMDKAPFAVILDNNGNLKMYGNYFDT